MERLPIKKWPADERPREKLIRYGRNYLTNAELIALLIRTGSGKESAIDLARNLLTKAGNDLARLSKMDLTHLTTIPGIGASKAQSIVSAFELGKRRLQSGKPEQIRINSSKDVYALMKSDLVDLDHEEFWIILLNRSNYVIKKIPVSKGGVSGTLADPRIIFNHAISHLSSGIILVHNHPSGNSKPSESDKRLTKKLSEGGSLLEIPVLDHIIFTEYGYFSFADENYL